MKTRLAFLALLLAPLFALQGCLVVPKRRMVDVDHSVVTTASGVTYQDRLVGTGELTPSSGMNVTIDYLCTLEDQTEVDSTYARGQAVTFVFGEAWLPGIEAGLVDMRVGGRRQITLPPDLAYGEAGVEGLIPANSPLFFELELVALD